MKIEVKQTHIDDGTPNKCSFCPIALAIRAARPDLRYVEVTYDAIMARESAHSPYVQFLLPDTAREFMRAFDSYKLAQPFTFDLVQA